MCSWLVGDSQYAVEVQREEDHGKEESSSLSETILFNYLLNSSLVAAIKTLFGCVPTPLLVCELYRRKEVQFN